VGSECPTMRVSPPPPSPPLPVFFQPIVRTVRTVRLSVGTPTQGRDISALRARMKVVKPVKPVIWIRPRSGVRVSRSMLSPGLGAGGRWRNRNICVPPNVPPLWGRCRWRKRAKNSGSLAASAIAKWPPKNNPRSCRAVFGA